ncbi:DUF6077 domain-containing protein [Eubacterium sp. MSJ-33]|uniref:DUF6077 domain-containing protein n=1 Tax=Eubacterium sp. MSJ-33 TaxID=2841528 RepID=UPI001C79A4C9|nr:DUF6077 domain-containing protein [Eubacterium sp. MSJ-33]QWT52119.1 hypothetical protein KP625_08420 [Eubacterium sp. MSJ-33]
MILIEFIKIIIIMVAMPLALGYVIFESYQFKLNKNDVLSDICYIFICGQVVMWAAFQLVAVPLIIAKSRLIVVTILWISLIVIALVAGYMYLRKKKSERRFLNARVMRHANKQDTICFVIMMLVALAIVGYQCYKYIFCMHIDNDDSRFVVNAVDAYEYGTMFLTNPANGNYMGAWVGELTKDVSSPWSIYLAMISKLIGIYPTVLAHTVYPPLLLAMGYASYYLIGQLLFGEKIKSIMLVIIIAVLNMSFGQSVYNQSYFTIVRIWQGKAVVAGMLIPFLTYLLIKLYKDEGYVREYIGLMLTGMAMCLMSGMGIFFSGIMIGVMGLWFTVIKRRWKKIPYLALSCLPTIVYGLSYMFIK